MNTIKDSVASIGEALNRHVEVISTSELFQNHVPSSFVFTEENVKTVTRLSGASNITYKVEFEGEEETHFIIYRKFMNKLVDFRIENLIFQKLSDQRQGPHCFYQCKEYRIEEYIPSRTATIFELRNPTFIKHLARQFAHFHCNKSIQEGVLELLTEQIPDKSPKTCLETFLDNWWKHIRDRLETLSSNLHREDYKGTLDEFVSVYYFPNFEEYWQELLPKSNDKVIAHTDMQETNILVLKPSPFEKK